MWTVHYHHNVSCVAQKISPQFIIFYNVPPWYGPGTCYFRFSISGYNLKEFLNSKPNTFQKQHKKSFLFHSIQKGFKIIWHVTDFSFVECISEMWTCQMSHFTKFFIYSKDTKYAILQFQTLERIIPRFRIKSKQDQLEVSKLLCNYTTFYYTYNVFLGFTLWSWWWSKFTPNQRCSWELCDTYQKLNTSLYLKFLLFFLFNKI